MVKSLTFCSGSFRAQKNCSHCSQEDIALLVSLVRMHFPQPESAGKSGSNLAISPGPRRESQNKKKFLPRLPASGTPKTKKESEKSVRRAILESFWTRFAFSGPAGPDAQGDC